MRNKIILGDCLSGLKQMNDDSVDVVFTSPPYADNGTESFDDIKSKGLGNNPYGTHRKYLNVESKFGKDWLDWQIEIINQCLRVCKKYLIYIIGAIKSNRSNVYKLIGYYSDYIHEDIIWYKPNGLPCRNEGSISNTYEHILIIKKNKNDKVKVNSNGFRNVITGIGVNSQNDFAEIHHAVMNKKLSDLIISEFTQKGDLILDPFMGMGTTALSCKQLGRDFCGFEICEEYYKQCIERIENDGFVTKNANDFTTEDGLF